MLARGGSHSRPILQSRMLLINIVSCSSAILMSSLSFAFSCFPGTEDIGSTESAMAHDVAMHARQDLLHP
jgi:hypothetical protein